MHRMRENYTYHAVCATSIHISCGNREGMQVSIFSSECTPTSNHNSKEEGLSSLHWASIQHIPFSNVMVMIVNMDGL